MRPEGRRPGGGAVRPLKRSVSRRRMRAGMFFVGEGSRRAVLCEGDFLQPSAGARRFPLGSPFFFKLQGCSRKNGGGKTTVRRVWGRCVRKKKKGGGEVVESFENRRGMTIKSPIKVRGFTLTTLLSFFFLFFSFFI